MLGEYIVLVQESSGRLFRGERRGAGGQQVFALLRDSTVSLHGTYSMHA